MLDHIVHSLLHHYNSSRLRLHLFNITTIGHARIKNGALVRSVGGYNGGAGAQGTEGDVEVWGDVVESAHPHGTLICNDFQLVWND